MVAVVEEVEVAAQLLLDEVDLVVAVHVCVLVQLVRGDVRASKGLLAQRFYSFLNHGSF